MPEKEPIFYNAFNIIREIGPVRFQKLRRYFSSMEQAWKAPSQSLEAAGLEANIAGIVVAKRPQIDPDKEMQELLAAGIEVLTADSPFYPVLLKEIYNPPPVLYARGNSKILAHEFMVAVVGTRKISAYGKQVAPLLAKELARAGVVVVSGLALGVDEAAHRATIEAGGITVAVLGSGIDDQSIYPASNRQLVKKIVETGGAVISELPLRSLPLKMHFPFRNRIISGMTLGTVVVEADLDSGSLITAKLALEQDRQVFAVPGSIFNQFSAGPNNLLKMGAKAVTAARDILEELNLKAATRELAARKILPETPTEAKILPLLSAEPIHIDKLILETGLPAGDVSSALVMMEIKGKVRNLGAMQYVIAR